MHYQANVMLQLFSIILYFFTTIVRYSKASSTSLLVERVEESLEDTRHHVYSCHDT